MQKPRRDRYPQPPHLACPPRSLKRIHVKSLNRLWPLCLLLAGAISYIVYMYIYYIWFCYLYLHDFNVTFLNINKESTFLHLANRIFDQQIITSIIIYSINYHIKCLVIIIIITLSSSSFPSSCSYHHHHHSHHHISTFLPSGSIREFKVSIAFDSFSLPYLQFFTFLFALFFFGQQWTKMDKMDNNGQQSAVLHASLMPFLLLINCHWLCRYCGGQSYWSTS